jgi:hypothetical protein
MLLRRDDIKREILWSSKHLLATIVIDMHSLSVAPLLGLLIYGANAAHIPSAKQLGDITLLAQNNLRSKLSPGTILLRFLAALVEYREP